MSTFNETKVREEQNIEQLHETIVVLSEQISRLINTGQNLPSKEELKALKVCEMLLVEIRLQSV